MKCHYLVFAAALVASGAIPVHSLEPAEIDAEIARLRKELRQVQADRQRNADDAAKEQKDFDAYKARNAKRLADTRAETEAIKAETKAQNDKRDSLSALVQVAQSQRRQVDLAEEQLRAALIASCDDALASCKKMPPLASQQAAASAGLIKSELVGKSVDEIEGMNRLAQVFARLEEATSSIQVSQETSPYAEIRGTVYRIRVGSLLEGVVDIKGEKAAVWRGNQANGEPSWTNVENADMLLKAASIREGKSLPSLARIPFPSDSTAGGAQ